MARVSIYLNFTNKTEEAFTFYKSVFGGTFTSINRFSEVPPQKGAPPMKEEDKKLIMHIELPIMGNYVLMGTDAPESMRPQLIQGNNMSIMLEPDTREEVDRLFHALSAGGKVEMPLTDMFWGAYYGSCTDKYGIQWMFNFYTKK